MHSSTSPFAAPHQKVPSPESEIKLPRKKLEFAGVFKKENENILPPHRDYDYPIDLQLGAKIPLRHIYGMSESELNTLHKHLAENLVLGFIHRSTSPTGAPILFSKKKDGSHRLCVDYWALNQITNYNQYPLTLIQEMLDQLETVCIFTKLSLQGPNNLV